MSAPVGALACQRDSFLRALSTKIVSVAQSPQAPAQLEVVLADTVLFPEGGGQPCDLGVLNRVLRVVNVQRRGATCVHFVSAAAAEGADAAVHATAVAALAAGADAHVEVDWARRWDHLQHHTGQHLLSAVLEQLNPRLPTESWALTHPFCNVVLPVARVTPEDIEAAERRCNELIAANAPVSCLTYATRDAVPEARSRGIPADVTGPIRIIDIAGVDQCTCCGTHASGLGQLGMLKVLHQEAKGSKVRLHFVVGERASAYFGDMFGRERALMKEFGINADGLLEAADRRGKALAAAQKSEKKLRAELTALLAPTVVAGAAAAAGSAAVFTFHREDADADMLGAFVEALAKDGATAARVCVLAGGAPKGEGVFVIAGPSEGAVKEFAETSSCRP